MAKKLPAHYAVPKAEGDGAVQAWIDLLPEWQTAHARRVDAVVTRRAPNVHKAIKWHAAWYNHEESDNHHGRKDKEEPLRLS